jgi:hypothetical protein
MGLLQICPTNLAQTAQLRAHAPRKALAALRAFSAKPSQRAK